MLLVSPLDDGFDGGVSKTYGPAKRRRASAYRRFPMGCGRNATVTSKEDHLRPPTAAAAAAANSGSLATLKESNGEKSPPSTWMGRHDAPMTGGAGEAQTVKPKTVEHKPEESGGPTEADGHWMEKADRSKKAKLGNLVKKELEEPNSVGHSEMDLGKAEYILGHQKSPVMMPTDDMFDGGVSKLYGPVKKRRASATRRFPAGCGRGAAAVSREPEAAKDGDSEMEVGRTEESLASLESHAKKEPEEAKGEDSKKKLQKAGVSLGNQELQVSTKRKNKLPAIRHFPVGHGKHAGVVSEGSHGGQAREGGRLGEEDEAESISESASNGSAMAALGRPPLDAKTPSQSQGRAAEKEARGSIGRSVKIDGTDIDGELSEAPVTVEVRAERIVQALMASPNCPWSRRKRLAK